MQNLGIFGSTGSVGKSTLDVVARHPERFNVVALTAARSVATMLLQCQQFHPQHVVMTNVQAADQLRQQLADLSLQDITLKVAKIH